jgi:hypothetical protein
MGEKIAGRTTDGRGSVNVFQAKVPHPLMWRAAMPLYAIIEIDVGLTVVEMNAGATPEEEAVNLGGTVIDPGPYLTYDDAYDAMLALQADDEEEK